jgi:HSP20 family protein
MLETLSPVLRSEPFSGLAQLRERLNRMLEDLLRMEPITRWEYEYPPCNLINTNDELILYCELPGLSRDDFHVEVVDNRLVLRGEKKFPDLPEGAQWVRHERSYGEFNRTIDLPYPVDRDKVKATFHDGVLEVHLPKTEEVRAKEIAIS